jgi:hypothetical protein
MTGPQSAFSETILAVDDELQVLSFISELLRMQRQRGRTVRLRRRLQLPYHPVLSAAGFIVSLIER